MKILIIHPKDITTDFLSESYVDLDLNIEIINSNNISKSILKSKILENDVIIMMGHGCSEGLFGYKRMVIDSNYVYLLRSKICIGIWCNAIDFFKKYNLNGYSTGMIISEESEALYFNIKYTIDDINNSNNKLSLGIRKAIKNIEFNNFGEIIKGNYSVNTEIDSFNFKNL